MSENSEHPPDDNEAETKAIEDLPNDSSKSEVKLMNRTNAAMLEDEEMPTYISVSSTSRRDDSDVVNEKQQEDMSQEMEEDRSSSSYPDDDQAASCIDLSSGEDTDQHPYNDEDDEDEYGESNMQIDRMTDMENLELHNDLDPEDPNNRYLMDEEEDDDEEDDDEDYEDEKDDEKDSRQIHRQIHSNEVDEDEKDSRQIHINEDDEDERDDEKDSRQIFSNEDDEDERNDGKDSRQIFSNEDDEDEKDLRQKHGNDDDTYDDNCDGRSDGFLLNRRIENCDKERSLSLQDLNMAKNKMDYIQRNSYDPYKKIKFTQFRNTYLYPTHGKQPMSERYHHVESRVKLYIKDIKEQNRRSMEKHMKQNQQDMVHSKSNANHTNSDIKETRPTITNKTIKDYAERTIKELEIAEACEGDKVTCAPQIILNGQGNKNYIDSKHEESTQNARSPINITQKQNGTVEDKQLKTKLTFPNEGILHYGNIMQPSLIPNIHQEQPPILFNLPTLNCEEFKHGISNSSQKINLNKNAHVAEQRHIQPETYNNAELIDMSIDRDDTTCLLKIENIKSIKTMGDEVRNNNEQGSSDKINELNKTAPDTSEITVLKNKLEDVVKKKEQFIKMYEEQKTENAMLKGVIKELKETLAKYMTKSVEQKVASTQTDVIDTAPEEHHNEAESTHVKQSENKIFGNSVASTLSSIDQWSDSAGNLSMKPPEVVKTLHSDDSILLTNGTPVKTTRSLSRTFITSSRILQTLSNITQGKTKLESPLVQNSKRRLSENSVTELQNDDSGCQVVNGSCRPSSSKKRKVADILEPSNFLSCKTPQTSIESRLKLHDTYIDSQHKHPYNLVNEKVESQENSSNINTSKLKTSTSMAENITETADDQEDNVKCFVYHENENSKDHSFLIIAKEPTKDKTVNEKRREGGPYIVGNVEVRMSEINGTINIWGKEISQESTAETETENEIEVSTKGIDDKKYHCWQKTPQTRFNGSNVVCSTSKKCKTPPAFNLSSVVSNCSCEHSPFNMAKASCSTDKAHAENLLNSSACVSCEDCELSKDHKEWLRCKQTRGQEKLHSCCIHNVDILEQNYSLHKEKQKFEDNFNYSKEKLSSKEHRRSFSRNPEHNKHLHKNIVNPATEEPTCKCHTCHNMLHDPGETCQESHKCYNTLKGTCTCEPLSMNMDRECNESCNHISNLHEEEPLITSKQCNETPEARRRRLTGKRVRGLLKDLLRGCGDCYSSNPSNSNKSCMHKKESCLTNCPPQIKISPCTSPEPSCSNPGQFVGRCCHAYAQRIESQLEEFRVEMERVRSRSDAILSMLNMLHSETN